MSALAIARLVALGAAMTLVGAGCGASTSSPSGNTDGGGESPGDASSAGDDASTGPDGAAPDDAGAGSESGGSTPCGTHVCSPAQRCCSTFGCFAKTGVCPG